MFTEFTTPEVIGTIVAIVGCIICGWILWYDWDYKLSGHGGRRANKIRRMNQ